MGEEGVERAILPGPGTGWEAALHISPSRSSYPSLSLDACRCLFLSAPPAFLHARRAYSWLPSIEAACALAPAVGLADAAATRDGDAVQSAGFLSATPLPALAELPSELLLSSLSSPWSKGSQRTAGSGSSSLSHQAPSAQHCLRIRSGGSLSSHGDECSVLYVLARARAQRPSSTRSRTSRSISSPLPYHSSCFSGLTHAPHREINDLSFQSADAWAPNPPAAAARSAAASSGQRRPVRPWIRRALPIPPRNTQERDVAIHEIGKAM